MKFRLVLALIILGACGLRAILLTSDKAVLSADFVNLDEEPVVLSLNDNRTSLTVMMTTLMKMDLEIALPQNVVDIISNCQRPENLLTRITNCLRESCSEQEVKPLPKNNDKPLDLDDIIDGLKNNQSFVNNCKAPTPNL